MIYVLRRLNNVFESYIEHPIEQYREDNSDCIANILHSLLSLEVQVKTIKQKLPDFSIDTKKAHLFYLMPSITPLIKWNNYKVRCKLEEFYGVINSELGLDYKQL